MNLGQPVMLGGALLFSGRRQPSCDGMSRMMREYHVRFCERLGVKFPGPTRHKATRWGTPSHVRLYESLATSPLTSERQVPTFHTKAWMSFAPPTCRMPSRQHSGPPPDSSRSKGQPPVSTSPNPLSTRQRWFACARLSRPCLPRSSSRLVRNPRHHGF